MRIKVEIADLVDEFEFKKSVIYVGAKEGCDIFLDYEGIGDKHLKITEENGLLYATDLASGFETISNNRTVQPGSKVELQTFLPIEIGGIFIFALDEVVDLSKDKNSYKISFDEPQQINEVPPPPVVQASEAPEMTSSELDIQELKKNLLQEDTPEKKNTKKTQKNFKPQLYAKETVEPTEFKIKDRVVNTNEIKVKSKQKKTASKKGVKTTGARKRKSKKRDQYIGHRFNLNSMIIIFCSLMIAGFFFYKKYRQELNLIKATEVNKVDNKFKLNVNSNEILKEYSDGYLQYANVEKCSQPNVKILCNNLASKFDPAKAEGIVLFEDRAFIGIEFSKIDGDITDLFKELPGDKASFEEIYKDGYTQFASIDQFVTNGHKTTLSGFKFSLDEYRDLIYFIHFIQTSNLGNLENLKKIHLFSFENFQNEITVRNFLDVDPKVFTYLINKKEKHLLKLRSFWNAYLTKDIKEFVASYGRSKFAEYSDEAVKEEQRRERRKDFARVLPFDKCLETRTKEFCLLISSNREKSSFEGIYFQDKDIYFFLDESKIINRYQDKYNSPYSNGEKKILIKSTQKMNIQDDILAGIINNDQKLEIPAFNHSRHVLYSDILLGNYLEKISKLQSFFENIYFVGAHIQNDRPYLKISLGFKLEELEKFKDERFLNEEKALLRYFWKSNITISDKFFYSSIESIDFSKSE